MIPRPYLLISAVAILSLPAVLADVGFSSPAAGAVISGSTIDVEFAEGSGTPPLASFTTYTLQLCAGGNGATDFTPLLTFTSQGDFSQTSYSAVITDTTIGGSDTNAYFLRSIGVAPGGTVYNYSPRFTLSGMTGQFSAAVQAGLKGVSGTAGPATVNNIANAQNSPAVAAGGAQYSVAYTMQSGPVRYAPMAVVAPSKITAKGAGRQFPTSGYSVWRRSGMPAPDATQTVTNPFTFAVSSMEPTMAAASSPDDMQKFLNRWKD